MANQLAEELGCGECYSDLGSDVKKAAEFESLETRHQQ